MVNKEEAKKIFTELTNKRVHYISLIPEGTTNILYNINDAYILRFRKYHDDLFYRSKNERDAIRKIAPLNISEIVLYYDEDTDVKLSKFIHGTHLYIDSLNEEQLRYSAKTLKKLHRANLKIEGKFNSLDRLYAYKKEAGESKIPNLYEKHTIRDALNFLKKEEKEFVLCHNDLVRNNLLFKFDKMLIIDWEYAGMNHPYFDLASFLSENNIEDEKTIETFLKFYFGSQFNSLKLRRIKLMYRYLDILWYYWALAMYKKRNEEVYEKIAANKLRRILAMANLEK